MDERFGVDILDTGNELSSEHKNRLEGEFAVAKFEEIFQAGSEKVEYHGIVIALSSEPTNERDPDTSGQRLVDTSFIFQLRVLGLYAL